MSNACVFRKLRKRYQMETGISIPDHDDETIDKWINDFSAYWNTIDKDRLKGNTLEEKKIYAALRMRTVAHLPDGIYYLLLLKILKQHPNLAELTDSKKHK